MNLVSIYTLCVPFVTAPIANCQFNLHYKLKFWYCACRLMKMCGTLSTAFLNIYIAWYIRYSFKCESIYLTRWKPRNRSSWVRRIFMFIQMLFPLVILLSKEVHFVKWNIIIQNRCIYPFMIVVWRCVYDTNINCVLIISQHLSFILRVLLILP